MRWGSFFYPHQVKVQSRQATAGRGVTWGTPRPLDAEVVDEVELVRDADGAEVVSSARVTVPLGEAIAPGDMVTVWPGTPQERASAVIAVARAENAAPLESHLVLTLR